MKRNPNLRRVPRKANVPYPSVHGWFYFKGHPDTRIEGSAHIGEHAVVCDHAEVSGEAQVLGRVTDCARVSDCARISEYAQVRGNATVYDDAQVCDSAQVYDNARVRDDARVGGHACVHGNARVVGYAWVGNHAEVYGEAEVCSHASVGLDAHVYDNAMVCGHAAIIGGHLIGRAITADVLRWRLRLVSPSRIRIGCEEHDAKEWLAARSSIPWKQHTTPAERKVVVQMIEAVLTQEALGKTWDKIPKKRKK